jgi:hypothetical protein
MPGLEQDLLDLRQSLEEARGALETLADRSSLLLALLLAVLIAQGVQAVLYWDLHRKSQK